MYIIKSTGLLDRVGLVGLSKVQKLKSKQFTFIPLGILRLRKLTSTVSSTVKAASIKKFLRQKKKT